MHEREREREIERAALCDGGGGGDRMMMSGGEGGGQGTAEIVPTLSLRPISI